MVTLHLLKDFDLFIFAKNYISSIDTKGMKMPHKDDIFAIYLLLFLTFITVISARELTCFSINLIG